MKSSPERLLNQLIKTFSLVKKTAPKVLANAVGFGDVIRVILHDVKELFCLNVTDLRQPGYASAL